MLRNPKLIKKILAYARDHADNINPISLPSFKGFTSECIEAHVELCAEAGFLIVEDTTLQFIDGGLGIQRLTWEGHEQLQAWRCDNGT